jgi:Kyakuja-Dileera-Zisupton transposase
MNLLCKNGLIHATCWPTPTKSERLQVAVGKFHLGVHVKSCFWKHTLNFIPGAGHLDGEIMETVWALLNVIAPATRYMSLGHRWEILNDFMRHFNFKKLVSMGK